MTSIDTIDEVQVPADIESERAVLCTMLHHTDNVSTALGEGLRSEDYYRPQHAAIHAAIRTLYDAGRATDAQSVAIELEQQGNLTRIGGGPYLHTLYAHTGVTGPATATYAAKIIDSSRRRAMLQRFERSIHELYHSEQGTAEELLERMHAGVVDLERTRGDDGVDLAEALSAVDDELASIANHGGEAVGIPSGFADLDDVTNGLHGGQLVIVAARPGVGKSTLALDMARAASIKNDHRTLVFSLEMSRTELAMRTLAAESRIRLADMRSGRMSHDDWSQLRTRREQIQSSALTFDDSPNLNLGEIRSKARKHQRRHGLDLIIVDYLQLMTTGRGAESRQVEVQEISRSLKLLAKELGVPVVALSQLNRGPEQRQDKRPQLADLRESGSVEQDADVVLLMHRPDAIERDDPRMGEADLILAKHRNGPLHTVSVAHQLQYSRFVDLAQE